jgi:hypothetical protein
VKTMLSASWPTLDKRQSAYGANSTYLSTVLRVDESGLGFSA